MLLLSLFLCGFANIGALASPEPFPEGNSIEIVINANLSCQVTINVDIPYVTNRSQFFLLIPFVTEKIESCVPSNCQLLYTVVESSSLLTVIAPPNTSSVSVNLDVSSLLVEKRVELDLSTSYTLRMTINSTSGSSVLDEFKELPNCIFVFGRFDVKFPDIFDPFRVDELPAPENTSLYSRRFTYQSIVENGGTLLIVFHNYVEGVQIIIGASLLIDLITVVLAISGIDEKVRSVRRKRVVSALMMGAFWFSVVYVAVFYYLPSKSFWNGALTVLLNIALYGLGSIVWFLSTFRSVRQSINRLVEKGRSLWNRLFLDRE
jgi:hypothetical protein